MPKKTKEEAEWVDDEVAQAAGKITWMFSEKLASSVTVNVNLAVVWLRCQWYQTPLKIFPFHFKLLIGNGVYLVINDFNSFTNL